MDQRVWHSHYRPEVPPEIDIKPVTMPEVLDRTVRDMPGNEAMMFMGKTINYEEFNRLVNRFAAGLGNLGVKPGDRVAVLLPNTPQVVISMFALWRLRAIPVPCNPLYTDAELKYQFEHAGVSAAICFDLLCPRVLALRDEVGFGPVVCCHLNSYLPFPLKQLFPFVKKDLYRKFEAAKDYYEFTTVIRDAPGEFSGPPPEMNDLALIPFTGGTTGRAKGVCCTHGNATSIAQIMDAWFYGTIDSKGRTLGVFPIFHIAGFTGVMNIAVHQGRSMALVPKPEPKPVLDMVLKYRPDFFPAVPTLYVGVMSLPEFQKADLSFIQGFFSGAAPLAIDTIEKLKAATGGDIIEVYGMTESCALVTSTPWRGTLKPGSAGVPLPNTDIKLVSIEDDVSPVAAGEPGQIAFRGPQMCDGYYNQPEETAAAIRDGWFYTGDVGKMDEDGFLYIVDRTKDMIVAGGFNIYPRDIEEVLYDHPAVLEACTVGVPDEYRGETVKAFVVLKDGASANEKELDAWCRERLTSYKVPKIYEFMGDLPKSAVGKILRRELRDAEWNKAGKDPSQRFA